jgi:hypothetical protein
MTKVQFFEDTDIASLQHRINDWLAEHKAIRIINSNISSTVMPDHSDQLPSRQRHVFFILYSASAKTDSLHKKMTAVNIIAQTDEQGLNTPQ